MKRSSILLATLVAVGLAACGEAQKPAPQPQKAPELVKPEGAAPTPPPPPPPAGDVKKDEKK